MAVTYVLISLSFAFTLLAAVGGFDFVGEWGGWTTCSAECDGGKQSRDKTCDGQLCDRIETSCHLMPCDDPFRGVTWSDCSQPCGPDGERTRTSTEGEIQRIRCNTQSCEPSEGDCIGDVVFVLDSSGSIGFWNWSVSTQFVIDVMKGLKVSSAGTRVSVVMYSTEVETCFGLTAYYSMDEIEPIVFNLGYMAGVTNTADGIMVMHQILKDQGRGADVATPIGVVITDGASNVDNSRTVPEAKSAQDDGIQMFAIAIGSGVNMEEINGIANNEDYVFHANSYGEVQSLTDVIADKICSKGNTEVCGDCGDFSGCSESCGAEGTMDGTKDCWLVSGVNGQEIPSSRHKVPCSDTCLIPCPVPECGPCGEYGPCSESCGVEGVAETTKDCWENDGTTGIEIPGSRHKVPCTKTCLIPCPVPECGPCGNYGPCSESCGIEGVKEGTKDCWENDGTTGVEIPGSRHQVPCSDTCLIPCPVPECGPCGEYGPCSESCGVEGIAETTQDCWENDGTTGIEIPGSRHKVPCTKTCLIPCPVPDCGPCGNYGPCSESCGIEGVKEGTKDCWENDGTTGVEIPGSRHQVPCSDTCLIPCPVPECGPCGEYGPCSESCGVEGVAETTQDCWENDGTTGIEIPGSRHKVPCTKTCFIPCPVPECGPCGDYGPCSESCGLEGVMEGTKYCWENDGTTGVEIPGSRHKEPCSDTCLVPCPTPECGPCGEYGPCSESCGVEGVAETTQDCWENDGTTGIEIPGSRHKVSCTKTCFIPCPVPECGPCGDYGPCSESCGLEGVMEGTKDCWENDGTTGVEIPGSRHKEPCSDPCFIRCPTPECGPCGEYGPCSESCGAEGVAETTKDCWLNDGETGVEVPGSRHPEPCTQPCFLPCPTTTTELWVPDCSRCDYTKGQIWLEDKNNCHMYFICEPLGNGEYRIHHVTCGALFWSQAFHTCVPVMPPDVDCEVGPINLYTQPSTPGVPCPYEPYPGDPSKYWINGDSLTINNCLEGMEFVNTGDLCDCLPVGPLIPKCEDDLLLYFPYEDHYNDVTCHQAIATKYGDGVSLQFDPDRNGNVACFTGGTHFEVAFLRTWFANNKVDKFTVSLWFKRQGEQFTPQGIVNNGDCIDTAGFLVGHAERTVMANITTEDARAQFPVAEVSDEYWHHVVWVYDGLCLKVYVDDRLEKTIPITGYLKNNDVPMYIANCCGEHFFTGCLDELRVYNRVLSPGEIEGLP